MSANLNPSQSTPQIGWEQARQALADLAAAREVPPASFPGHHAIYCANLEGFLGGCLPVLLRERDELLLRLADVAAVLAAVETDEDGFLADPDSSAALLSVLDHALCGSAGCVDEDEWQARRLSAVAEFKESLGV